MQPPESGDVVDWCRPKQQSLFSSIGENDVCKSVHAIAQPTNQQAFDV